MSILSELGRKAIRYVKRLTGQTEAELAFSLVASQLSPRDREELRQSLASVQYAVGIAYRFTGDARVKEAQEWTDAAIEILSK